MAAARRKLEDVLAALARVRDDPRSEASLREVRAALAGPSPFGVAKAARLAGELEMEAVVPEMEAAFERLMARPGGDPGCTAKAAVAEALYRLGHDGHEVFLKGIRHVQLEPGFGGRVDTAIDLRGASALGLVRIGWPRALLELADLLADPAPPARMAAARALAYRGGEDAVPLLRLRVLAGDEAPVIGECLGALLSLAPKASLPFAARFLDADDETVAEAAALALGASRSDDALPLLRDWTERAESLVLQRVGLLAIATLRREPALDYLLGQVAAGDVTIAAEALGALAIYRGDAALADRARQAAQGRDEPRVQDALRRAFD